MVSNHRLVLFTHALCRLSYPAINEICSDPLLWRTGVLSSYFHYYHTTRTHLSLDKDCPQTRPVHRPAAGKSIMLPEVGGRITARTPGRLSSVVMTHRLV